MPKSSLPTRVCLFLMQPVFSGLLMRLLAMDTDKIKIFGARVKVDSTGKLAELERAERVSTPANTRLSTLTD
jgi:hypothetical protein